ncbi:MAG: hypothetical protein VKL59_21345 [Nostocaceae cyanobacterium]|nr:hypothetical protein [Nostocaceae cyanobacterium]
MKLLLKGKKLCLPIILMASLLTVSGCNNEKTPQPPKEVSQNSPEKVDVKDTAETTPGQKTPTAVSSPNPNSSSPSSSPKPGNNQQTITETPELKDTLIVPGERVGPVTPKTSKQDLVQLFGESRLTDKTISGPEGIGTFAATEVNLGEDKSFLVVWSDDTRSKILDIRNLGSAWKTPEGIGVGTSFSELRTTLGEFKLTGLGWDYGGYVNLQGTKLSRYRGKLILGVDADYKIAQKFPQNLQAVSGDRELSSTNSNWKPLDVKVQRLIVVFSHPTQ